MLTLLLFEPKFIIKIEPNSTLLIISALFSMLPPHPPYCKHTRRSLAVLDIRISPVISQNNVVSQYIPLAFLLSSSFPTEGKAFPFRHPQSPHTKSKPVFLSSTLHHGSLFLHIIPTTLDQAIISEKGRRQGKRKEMRD